MSNKEQQERSLLLQALIMVWVESANENPIVSKIELERLIAWQVLGLSGAYEQHAEDMWLKRMIPIVVEE